ncbi:MAG: LytTR family transcriptional regulator DNA-binding domain-containing protein [Sphingobacteriales bacterium]|nr:LytTR family transcriptional regulator DNA-binding domain-containing protein [Sphingobacteriales bacterium]
MSTCIIIDDEPLARSIVVEYLMSFPEIKILAECSDGFEGMKAIQQLQPDIVFLDVQMPKINGFELLELIDNPPAIIFTTAFDEYALKAFEANAIDYLLKPFNKERFDKSIQKFKSNLIPKINTEQLQMPVSPTAQNRIVVKVDGKIKIIPTVDIQYIEANGDNVKIMTNEGSFSKNKTMSFFEEQLSANDFVRIHRSYLVNVSLVTRIDAYDKESHLAVLSSGIQLPVSKSGYQRLKELLGM